MGDRVLDDERLDALGMREDHAKTDGAAVVLHIQVVAGETEGFGEVIHDFGDVVERVGELFRVGPVAMAEAGVIGRDKAIAIGKSGEERLEHAGGRGKAVEEEKRRGIFRTGFSVKDREAIYLCGAKDSWVGHGMFLRLMGLGQQRK